MDEKSNIITCKGFVWRPSVHDMKNRTILYDTNFLEDEKAIVTAGVVLMQISLSR